MYKWLSYRRETALQGGLVMAKGVGLELEVSNVFMDIIRLQLVSASGDECACQI